MLCQKDAMYWLYWNSSDILEHFDKIWPAWRPLCCDSPFQKRQDLRNAFNTSWYIIVHPSSISVEDPYPIPLTRKRFPALHAENIRKRQSIKTSFQSHCKLSDRVYVCFFLILLISSHIFLFAGLIFYAVELVVFPRYSTRYRSHQHSLWGLLPQALSRRAKWKNRLHAALQCCSL